MLLYDKQFEMYLNLNDNYKIEKLATLNVAIFKDLGEGVVMVKLPNI